MRNNILIILLSPHGQLRWKNRHREWRPIEKAFIPHYVLLLRIYTALYEQLIFEE